MKRTEIFGSVSRAPILTRSFRFYFANAVTIIGFGLLSAIGRAIQVGWEDSIPLLLYLLLGGIVWGSRIGIFLVAIGGGSLRVGSATIRRIHKMSEQERETNVESMGNSFKHNWLDVAVSFVIFLIFVYLIPNIIISQIAENESVLGFVQYFGLQGLDDESVRTVIVFFLKNITIIPFTIVWMFYGLPEFLRNRPGVPAG
jgi:steroid 5-alpha reductase family enzyme